MDLETTARFWSKVQRRGAGECWGWTGTVDPSGRARFCIGGRPELAHRVAWMIAHGECPTLPVSRSCANTLCVNPAHMTIGAQRKNTRHIAERFWEKVEKSDGCWTWVGSRNDAGYGTFNVKGRPMLAHRVSWAMANGEPGAMFVCHHCDNPPCVRPDHLFLGTNADNVADMDRKGRRINANTKLSAHDVVNAIRRRRHGDTLVAIAKDMGVSPAAISRVTGRDAK